jgi:hypothetical protein
MPSQFAQEAPQQFAFQNQDQRYTQQEATVSSSFGQ